MLSLVIYNSMSEFSSPIVPCLLLNIVTKRVQSMSKDSHFNLELKLEDFEGFYLRRLARANLTTCIMHDDRGAK